MKLFGIVGWKNAGKTTLTERLVAEFVARGHSVSTIKHTHHAVDLDRPGTDTWRHRQGGAHEVILASDSRHVLMHELRGTPEPELAALAARLSPVDLVLVEGFKASAHPKIEAAFAPGERPLRALDDPSVLAVAAGHDVGAVPVPVLPIDDISAIADFIADRVGL